MLWLTIDNHREWCLTNLSLRLRDDTHRSATCLRWASQTPRKRWCLTSSKDGNAALSTFLSRCRQRGTYDLRKFIKLARWLMRLDRCGGNIPVKLNIRWDRIAAICLCKRIVQTSCVVLETPSCLSEGEVCLKSRNQKTKKIKDPLDQRTKWVWRSHHEVYLDQPSLNELKTNIEAHERSEWSAQPMN